MTVFKWKTNRVENNAADSTVNWREGQNANTVVGAMRGMMAAMAKFRDDRAGNTATGGTADAFTLTSGQGFTELQDGLIVTCRMSANNNATATLNVDSLGAKNIGSVYGTDIAANELVSGSIQTFYYNETDEKWIALNRRSYMESGTICVFQQASAPTGWTRLEDNDDVMLRVVTGTPSSGGSSGMTALLASRTIDGSQMPVHTHSASYTLASAGAHTHTYTFFSSESDNRRNSGGAAQHDNVWKSTSSQTTGSAGAHTHTFSGETGTTGTGAACDFAVEYVDFIEAQKD